MSELRFRRAALVAMAMLGLALAHVARAEKCRDGLVLPDADEKQNLALRAASPRAEIPIRVHVHCLGSGVEAPCPGRVSALPSYDLSVSRLSLLEDSGNTIPARLVLGGCEQAGSAPPALRPEAPRPISLDRGMPRVELLLCAEGLAANARYRAALEAWRPGTQDRRSWNLLIETGPRPPLSVSDPSVVDLVRFSPWTAVGWLCSRQGWQCAGLRPMGLATFTVTNGSRSERVEGIRIQLGGLARAASEHASSQPNHLHFRAGLLDPEARGLRLAIGAKGPSLAPGEPQVFAVELGGGALAGLGPGEYRPSFEAIGEGATGEAKTFIVRVRHHWWIAFLTAALGALVGYWAGTRLPRRLKDDEILRTCDDLRERLGRLSARVAVGARLFDGPERSRAIQTAWAGIRRAMLFAEASLSKEEIDTKSRPPLEEAVRRTEILEAVSSEARRIQFAARDGFAPRQSISEAIERVFAKVADRPLGEDRSADATFIDEMAKELQKIEAHLLKGTGLESAIRARALEAIESISALGEPPDLARLRDELDELRFKPTWVNGDARRCDRGAERALLLAKIRRGDRDRTLPLLERLGRSRTKLLSGAFRDALSTLQETKLPIAGHVMTNASLEQLQAIVYEQEWERIVALLGSTPIPRCTSGPVRTHRVADFAVLPESHALLEQHPCEVVWLIERVRRGWLNHQECPEVQNGPRLSWFFLRPGGYRLTAEVVFRRSQEPETSPEIGLRGEAAHDAPPAAVARRTTGTARIRVEMGAEHRRVRSAARAAHLGAALTALFAIVLGLHGSYDATFGSGTHYLTLFSMGAAAAGAGSLFAVNQSK